MPADISTRLDPPREGDTTPRPTAVAGVFFSECHPSSLALGGEEREFHISTFVTVVGRLNGRVLLKTDDSFYRWSAADFLFVPKKK